jgi:hypothetical protein
LPGLAQQFAVVEKEFAQNFGNGEDILAVGYGIENRFLEMMAELERPRQLNAKIYS